jgi:HSP20 family molecular chaperone IbpA
MSDEIVIVGTAHVSERSALDVRETIRDQEPDVVAVELDPRRYETVRERDDTAYGGDMSAAVEEAEEQNIPVVLIDREIRVTLRRFWEELSFLERLKTVGALILGFLGFGGVDVEEIDRAIEEDRVEGYVEQLREFSPGGARALIDERDAYMASRLSELEGDVVAVVGAGHEQGIREYLEDPDGIPEVPGDSYGHGAGGAKADVYEDEEQVVVVADLPGYASDEVDVRVSGNSLVIEATKDVTPPDGFRFVGRRRRSRVREVVDLPVAVDSESATAKQENGILRVFLPKRVSG